MVEGTGQKGFAYGLGGSLAAHAAAALVLVVAPAAFPPARLDAASEIAIEIAEPVRIEAPALPEPASPSTFAAPTPATTPAHRERAAVPVVPSEASIVLPEATQTTVPLLDQTPLETPSQRLERLRHARIDPLAAAQSVVAFEGDGPSQRRGPQGPRQEERPDEHAIEQALSTSMREEAMARPWLTHTTPQLRRQPDGSYLYEGHAFRATIQPNGEVTFDDRPAVQTGDPNARHLGSVTSTGSFDMGDIFMRAAGQDPYAAERMWFMEETEDQRMEIESEHRRQAMIGAVADIPGEMRRIWRHRGWGPSRRRREIFEWFDETDDSAGAAARTAILAWVRENLPEGSDDGYAEEELDRLNASRTGSRPFRPYD